MHLNNRATFYQIENQPQKLGSSNHVLLQVSVSQLKSYGNSMFRLQAENSVLFLEKFKSILKTDLGTKLLRLIDWFSW